MSSSLHLEIAIVPASGLSAHERKGLEDWFQEEFGHLPYEWAEPEWYAVARSEDGSVGRLAIVQRQVAVVGQPVRVGGVGGVITKPEYRGCGVATALMLNANAFIKDNLGAEFGLLLCRREVAPVYAKAGWIWVPGPTHFLQSSGTYTYPRDTMIFKCAERDWPSGPIDLCGLPW